MKAKGPKTPKREAYKAESVGLPAFLRGGRSRVKETVSISASASREMRDFLKWAVMAAGMPVEELQVGLLDKALLDYFKNDSEWQEVKRQMRPARPGGPGSESTDDAEEALDVPRVSGPEKRPGADAGGGPSRSASAVSGGPVPPMMPNGAGLNAGSAEIAAKAR